jgi:hypothetical protein
MKKGMIVFDHASRITNAGQSPVRSYIQFAAEFLSSPQQNLSYENRYELPANLGQDFLRRLTTIESREILRDGFPVPTVTG